MLGLPLPREDLKNLRIEDFKKSEDHRLKIKDLSLNAKIKLQKTRNFGNEMFIFWWPHKKQDPVSRSSYVKDFEKWGFWKCEESKDFENAWKVRICLPKVRIWPTHKGPQIYGKMGCLSRRRYLWVTVGVSSMGSQWRTKETAQHLPL